MPAKTSPRDQTLLDLAYLRDNLLSLMKPEVLSSLADLLQALGTDNSFVHQFRTWVEKNGSDCRYAQYARQFFLDDHAENVALEICKLYNNWAKYYDKKGK